MFKNIQDMLSLRNDLGVLRFFSPPLKYVEWYSEVFPNSRFMIYFAKNILFGKRYDVILLPVRTTDLALVELSVQLFKS